MKITRQIAFLWVLPILLGALWVRSTTFATPVGADDCLSICSSDDDDLACNKKKKSCWEQKIDATQAQAATLTSTINLLNGQISLQQLQVDLTFAEINQLEGEVTELSERIKGLGYSLDRLSTVLIERVQAQYKQSRMIPSLQLLGSNSLESIFTNMKYLSLAQKQTADVMARTENQRLEYDDQKLLKEEKQDQLEVKKISLEGLRVSLQVQKNDQQYFLSETKKRAELK